MNLQCAVVEREGEKKGRRGREGGRKGDGTNE